MKHRNSIRIRLPPSTSYEERCAARERAKYRIVEEIDGKFNVFLSNTDPDDLVFGRAFPLATFNTHDEAVAFTTT
jgi:hypothetical protein